MTPPRPKSIHSPNLLHAVEAAKAVPDRDEVRAFLDRPINGPPDCVVKIGYLCHRLASQTDVGAAERRLAEQIFCWLQNKGTLQ